MEITEEQLDEIGLLVDRLDNLISAGKLGLSDSIKVIALEESISDFKCILKKLYVDISGEDPWKEHDSICEEDEE